MEKMYTVTFHVLQQDKFPFRTTQQKVVPYRVLHGLSVELSYFSHRATSKKLLLYYTVLWFTDGVVVQRRFSLVECLRFLVLFLISGYVKMTSPKTSSKVIRRNNSSNNLLCSIFRLKSGQKRNVITYSKSYFCYVCLRNTSSTAQII